MDIQKQVAQLFTEVAAAGVILPPILMFMPKNWSDIAKRLTTFVASLLLTVYVVMQNGNLTFTPNNLSLNLTHLIVILVVANQTYDKFWAPATQAIAAKTKLKFLHRSNK